MNRNLGRYKNNPVLHQLDDDWGHPQDEISLVDLFLVVIKHKKIVLGVMFLCVLVGITLSFIKPRVFVITTPVEIAKGVETLIEAPETVQAKLKESYIPFVLNKYFDESGGGLYYDVEASLPKDSEIILLKSKGTDEELPVYSKIHAAILDKLANDHGRTIAVLKRNLESELHQTENKLGELGDQAELLKTREARLDETEKLLASQIDDVSRLIAESRKNRKLAVNEVTGEAKAMTLLLIDSEIQQYQKRLSELEEQHAIGVKNDRDELSKAQADNVRAQNEQREKIHDINAKIAELRHTRAITETLKSIKPSGAGKALIISISVLLGLILGLTSAFLYSFYKQLQLRLKTEQA
ncbi:MAG: Wzz/FepE/Etk N-terminal domain-containing protein [Gammaproteobacteria bacterium]